MQEELPEGQKLDEDKVYLRIKKRNKFYSLIWELIKCLILACVSNFNMMVYLFMIIAMIQNGDLITLVYPVSIFAYAVYEECRPNKKYWQFIIIYTLIVIIIKFAFQTYPLSGFMTTYNDGYWNNLLWSYRVGFMTITTDTQPFLNYFIFEALVILFVTFHMF